MTNIRRWTAAGLASARPGQAARAAAADQAAAVGASAPYSRRAAGSWTARIVPRRRRSGTCLAYSQAGRGPWRSGRCASRPRCAPAGRGGAVEGRGYAGGKHTPPYFTEKVRRAEVSLLSHSCFKKPVCRSLLLRCPLQGRSPLAKLLVLDVCGGRGQSCPFLPQVVSAGPWGIQLGIRSAGSWTQCSHAYVSPSFGKSP